MRILARSSSRITLRRVSSSVLSLLPELLEELKGWPKKKSRPRSEFFREAIRRYIEEKKWERIYRYGRLKAQEQGLAEEDVDRLVDEDHVEQMNAKGSN